MPIAAFGCIVSIQFDGHVAVSLCGNGSCSLLAHIDIHIGDGDLGGLILLCLDGDGIRGRSRVAVRLGDDGVGGLLFLLRAALLGDVLPILPGFHGDAAIGQVILLCQCTQRDRRHQQQRHGKGKKLLFHHGWFLLLRYKNSFCTNLSLFYTTTGSILQALF